MKFFTAKTVFHYALISLTSLFPYCLKMIYIHHFPKINPKSMTIAIKCKSN